MTFTDDDLKRLKEYGECKADFFFCENASLDSLLARLETAEVAVQEAQLFILGGTAGGDIHWESFQDAYKVWCKAAGK